MVLVGQKAFLEKNKKKHLKNINIQVKQTRTPTGGVMFCIIQKWRSVFMSINGSFDMNYTEYFFQLVLNTKLYSKQFMDESPVPKNSF